MNYYLYWYFMVYSLYEKFSRDKHFDIFVTGLFSVFVGFFTIGIVGIIMFLMNKDDLVLDAKEAGGIGIVELIFNYIYFNQRTRQRRLYYVFKENRSNNKDLISVGLTLLSIALFVIAARINKY